MKKKKLKTRFPMARIKKIMQSDEDVGKVATASPVLISKALELFLQDLLDSSVAIVRERNAKTLSPFHLKQCITKQEKFDFLSDLVASVPDIEPPSEVKRRGRPPKAESNSSEAEKPRAGDVEEEEEDYEEED